MKLQVLAVVLLLGVATARLCSEDANCLKKPDRSKMNKVMPLIMKEYEQCQKAHKCPTRLAAESTTKCVNGFAGEYQCKGIDLVSMVPLADLGSSKDGNDIWGATIDNREIAIMGCMDGTSFVDITNPSRPAVLGFLPTQTRSSVWRDIKVYDHYAFIVADNAGAHGMQVFDLHKFRGVAGRVPTQRNFTGLNRDQQTVLLDILAIDSIQAVNQLSPDAVYTQFGDCHNIVINEETGFAYGVGSDTCAGGLHMIDIRDPVNPTFAGCYSEDGYTHDAQCVIYSGPDTRFRGREICFNYNEDTLTIVDVTDKTGVKMLSRTGYTNAKYTHQGWLTADQASLVMNDELDEVETTQKHTRSLLWDVTDLTKPVWKNVFLSSAKAIDHNLYIHKNKVWEANYAAGLRVLDASALPNSATEVAYFDVSPGPNDDVTFTGSWSVYPFFKSGLIVVSSIERGLFILRPQ